MDTNAVPRSFSTLLGTDALRTSIAKQNKQTNKQINEKNYCEDAAYCIASVTIVILFPKKNQPTTCSIFLSNILMKRGREKQLPRQDATPLPEALLIGTGVFVMAVF